MGNSINNNPTAAEWRKLMREDIRELRGEINDLRDDVQEVPEKVEKKLDKVWERSDEHETRISTLEGRSGWAAKAWNSIGGGIILAGYLIIEFFRNRTW